MNLALKTSFIFLILMQSYFAYSQNGSNELSKTPLKILKQKTFSGKYQVRSIQKKEIKNQIYYLVVLSSTPQEKKQKYRQLEIELKNEPKQIKVDDTLLIKAELLNKIDNNSQLAQFAFLLKNAEGVPKLVRFVSRHAKDLIIEKPSYLRMHSPSSDYILF